MKYEEFMNEISNRLTAIGFELDDAKDISQNYRGLYYSEKKYKPVSDVIDHILEKPCYQILLDDKILENYRKEHGYPRDWNYAFRSVIMDEKLKPRGVNAAVA